MERAQREPCPGPRSRRVVDPSRVLIVVVVKVVTLVVMVKGQESSHSVTT